MSVFSSEFMILDFIWAKLIPKMEKSGSKNALALKEIETETMLSEQQRDSVKMSSICNSSGKLISHFLNFLSENLNSSKILIDLYFLSMCIIIFELILTPFLLQSETRVCDSFLLSKYIKLCLLLS